jgi:hypothetical protein
MSAEQMVYLVLAIAGAVGGAYWRFSSVVASVKDDLAAHRLHTAETYVTKAGMQEQTAQIMHAIDGIGKRIDGISERLDRAFESKPRPRS